jgi:hypothetical protein
MKRNCRIVQGTSRECSRRLNCDFIIAPTNQPHAYRTDRRSRRDRLSLYPTRNADKDVAGTPDATQGWRNRGAYELTIRRRERGISGGQELETMERASGCGNAQG